ncbi:hypothetical protein B566_EDAN005837 [Ephemera danica]|nr:hypothetical protein B566_EDAN005837 [Ephemera danica]
MRCTTAGSEGCCEEVDDFLEQSVMLTPTISRVLLLVHLFCVTTAKHCNEEAQQEGLQCLQQEESVDEVRHCRCKSNCLIVMQRCTLDNDSYVWKYDNSTCASTNFILIISITSILALLLLACIIGIACFVRTKVQKKQLENELKQMTLMELRRVMATPSTSVSPQIKRPVHEKTDSAQLEYDYIINPKPIMERITTNELKVPQSTKSKTKNAPPIHKTESITRYENVKSRKREDEIDTATADKTVNVEYDEIEDDEHEYATIDEVQDPQRAPKPVEYMNYK